jgi:hypothetical protein
MAGATAPAFLFGARRRPLRVLRSSPGGAMAGRGAGSGAGVLDSNTDKSIGMDVEGRGVARWCPDVEDTYHRVLKDEVMPRLLTDRHRLFAECDPGSGLAGAA